MVDYLTTVIEIKEEDKSKLEEISKELKDVCKKYNIKIVTVYYPEYKFMEVTWR